MDRNDFQYRQIVDQVRSDPRSQFCFVSGVKIPQGGGDPHHVLPVAQFPEMALLKQNIVIVTRQAHRILTDGTAEQIARLIRIHALLARMRFLDHDYYSMFYERLEPFLVTVW